MGANFKTLRLGESRYYVSLPDYMTVQEARGKEGQLGYNIRHRDGSFKIFGFIEIRRGDPIGGGEERGDPIELVESVFLSTKITWEIYKTEIGRWEATTRKQDIRAEASAANSGDLERMIAFISTLTVK